MVTSPEQCSTSKPADQVTACQVSCAALQRVRAPARMYVLRPLLQLHRLMEEGHSRMLQDSNSVPPGNAAPLKTAGSLGGPLPGQQRSP